MTRCWCTTVRKNSFSGWCTSTTFTVRIQPKNKELKAPHKAIVSAIMNPGIATIEWGANVTQAIAKARLQTPHGILVRDERGRFAGFLSTTDLNVERERMDRLAAQHRRT